MSTDVHIHVHIHNEPEEALVARVTALETQVADIVADLTALNAQVQEYNEDVSARIAALEAAQGTFTAEQQVAFDALKATVEAGVTLVGDADGDGNPAPVVPTP